MSRSAGVILALRTGGAAPAQTSAAQAGSSSTAKFEGAVLGHPLSRRLWHLGHNGHRPAMRGWRGAVSSTGRRTWEPCPVMKTCLCRQSDVRPAARAIRVSAANRGQTRFRNLQGSAQCALLST